MIYNETSMPTFCFNSGYLVIESKESLDKKQQIDKLNDSINKNKVDQREIVKLFEKLNQINSSIKSETNRLERNKSILKMKTENPRKFKIINFLKIICISAISISLIALVVLGTVKAVSAWGASKLLEGFCWNLGAVGIYFVPFAPLMFIPDIYKDLVATPNDINERIQKHNFNIDYMKNNKEVIYKTLTEKKEIWDKIETNNDDVNKEIKRWNKLFTNLRG